jgi:hypothetical protein
VASLFYTTPTDDGAMTVTCDRCLVAVACPDPFAAASAITHHHCDPDTAVPGPHDREPALDEQPALHLLAGWSPPAPAAGSSWSAPEARPAANAAPPA